MDADLDHSLHRRFIARRTISCPRRRRTPGEASTDAEVVTLCVAQAIMGIPATGGFSLLRPNVWGTCSPAAAGAARYFKRRRRLTETIECVLRNFASRSPGFHDDLLLIDCDAGRVCSQP